MKIKNLLLALLYCFFSLNALQAQDDFEGCNTPEPTQAQLDYHNLFEGLMFSFDLNAQPNVIYTIPITAHVARLDNGTGGLTTQQLDDAIAIVNDYYLNAKLQFSICGINYMDDNSYYDYSIGDEPQMTATHNVANTINIYFVNSIQGGLYCGYTRIPPSSDVVLMANNCVTSGNTLSHELGHYFSLYHTHGKSNFGTTDELVDGSNCNTAGDDICDTPADPNLYGKVNGSCAYTATDTDANGMLYTPNVNNIMSYAPKFCRDEFTQGQYERVLFGYLNHRYYLTPDAGFATNTNNLDATFTNTSMGDGVLSYTWDFGDGNTSTMQDPTHTYAAEGIYTICLEVTDGCGIDMYCEDVNISIAVSCLAADSLELVNLYNVLGGDNWVDNSGWLVAPVSEWYGIMLTDDGCNVKTIDLRENNVIGQLFDFSLPELTSLIFRFNQLYGSIPNFSNIPKLTYLHLNANELTGNIPDFSNIPNLVLTLLSNNQFTGNIPNFSNLPNMKTLYISSTQINGNIPNFDNFPNIEQLFLIGNQLTGNLPNLNQLGNLKTLRISNNQLSGTIPNYDNLNDLAEIRLEQNQFTFAGFENNIVNSNISTFYYSPQVNIPIYQNGNTLYVSAGGTLSNNTYTWYKDSIEIATIVADSTFIATETGTYYCTVSNSIITNPDEISQNLVLQSEDIVFTSNVSCLAADSLELVNFYNALGGDNWTNNDGWLTAPVSDWYGITLTDDGCSVKEMDLTSNNLVGTLMDWNFADLTYLNLTWNQISGNIPDFNNLSNLIEIHLFKNQLDGNIPDFSNLPNLRYLYLHYNQLSGNVPDFSNLTSLRHLHVHYNQLSGIIPSYSRFEISDILQINIDIFYCKNIILRFKFEPQCLEQMK